MALYEVGKLYHSGKHHWPEGVDYNYRSGQHELRLFMRTPSPREIADVKTGEARFALSIIGERCFFCYKFGGGDWGDCGFSIHLVPENERVLPDASMDQSHALLTILLVDAETGILKAIRATTLSPRFTQKLHEAIRDQATKPFPADYDQQLETVYRRYTSAELAQQRAIARCRGGE